MKEVQEKKIITSLEGINKNLGRIATYRQKIAEMKSGPTDSTGEVEEKKKMIRIEDACKVCREMMINYGSYEMDEEIEAIIRQEMEQKLWIAGCQGDAREVLEDIYDRITDIHPKMIAEAIKEDGLKDWCKKTQVALNMLLVKLPIKHEE